MKLNINVLIGCALCVVLIGVFGALNRTADSRDDWRPSEAYSRVGGSAYSAVSYSAASSSANGLGAPAVSMRGSNSMLRRRAVSSYAPAYSAPTSLIASSPYRLGASASSSVAPVYTTSSATAKSFGSGNAVSGVSMSGGSVRAAHSQSSITNSQSSIANIQLPIANIQSPTANTQLPISNIQSPIASNYQGIGNTTIGGPRGLGGRFNAPPGVGDGDDADGSSYSSWLGWMEKHGWKYGDTYDGDGHYYYDKEQARAAYEAWVASLPAGLPIPDFEDWLLWFSSENTHTSGDYQFSYLFPVGDAWPLLVLALMYVLLIAFRKYFKHTCI
jgi:hypothetical protein